MTTTPIFQIYRTSQVKTLIFLFFFFQNLVLSSKFSNSETTIFTGTHKRSGPAANTRGNSLNMRRESFSSRIRNSFCSWATIRDNFFVNRVVQTWNSLPNSIVTSPSLNSFKSALDGQFKRFGCYSF